MAASPDGEQADDWNGWSGDRYDQGHRYELSDLSTDGRYVVFSSAAGNLVAHDTNHQPDVFVRDTVRGSTVRASVGMHGHQANGRSWSPSISDDGRYVAFTSEADNLVSADRNRVKDVYLRDLVRKRTILVSRDSHDRPLTRTHRDASYVVSMSDDGRRVVFSTAAAGIPSDTQGSTDLYVRLLPEGRTVLVTHDRRGRAIEFSGGSISGNGRYVAFASLSRRLLPPGTPVLGTTYVRDLRTGAVRVASAGDGDTPENGYSDSGALSASGRFVMLMSSSTNLTPTPSPDGYSVFVRDLVTGDTWYVAPEVHGGDLSGDASVAVFTTDAGLLPEDTNDGIDVFAWDRASGVVTRLNVQPDGSQSAGEAVVDVGGGYAYGPAPAISTDARHVVFPSSADDLVPGDTNGAIDLFDATLDRP